jgi:hypothetical protein
VNRVEKRKEGMSTLNAIGMGAHFIKKETCLQWSAGTLVSRFVLFFFFDVIPRNSKKNDEKSKTYLNPGRRQSWPLCTLERQGRIKHQEDKAV